MKAMHVTALYVAAGLVGGFALSALIGGDAASDGERVAFVASDTSLERRVAQLESQLNAVNASNMALADALERLDERVAQAVLTAPPPGDVPTARVADAPFADDPVADPRAMTRERFREAAFRGDRRDLAERLTEAGFSQSEAQRIETRLEELSVEAMQARYEALRSDEPQSALEQLRDSSATLRGELGEADYERYLEASGRPTSVAVATVLSSSAAQTAGLQPGDQIVAYAGERVFDVRELNQALLEGESGEPVIVDVVRDGQPIQIVIPRGPLGISSGFSRRGPR